MVVTSEALFIYLPSLSSPSSADADAYVIVSDND